MKAEFTIGRVLRPRGIKGVVKIETYSENTSRLLHLRTLNVGGTHYRLENASSEGVFLYAKLEGVDTPEDAEKYGLSDKQVVSVEIKSAERSLIFGDTVVRVSPNYALAMHIDTDESNAVMAPAGTLGVIL